MDNQTGLEPSPHQMRWAREQIPDTSDVTYPRLFLCMAVMLVYLAVFYWACAVFARDNLVPS